MNPVINIAIKAARLAGNIILRADSQRENLQIIKKGLNDYASQVDKTAELAIIETIKTAYPHHAILGEESGHIASDQASPTTWIIDPLDGTTNFLHDFPHYCVSIAVTHQDKIQHGVIYDPIRDELFTASRGEGAQLNGRRLRISGQEKLENALLGTGFPFRKFDHLDSYLKMLKTLLPQCAGIRRAGSAALDLAYLAAGRLDGFWEFDLRPWDIAAGCLMVQEAGGWVTTLEGDQNFLYGQSLLAAGPKIYQKMFDLCKTYLTTES